MTDYSDYTCVANALKSAQNADSDNREYAIEADHFLNKSDGQWEPTVVSKMRGRPRYTFDMCNPIVDQITAEIEQADFDIRVRPAGGDATKELANTYDGIIRNIENLSNASTVFSKQARNMIGKGIGGWRVITDWAQSDSFDQDLLIEPIENFEDRVWFDPASEKQDRSDANWCHVLQALSKEEYMDRWPKGSCMSVSDDRRNSVYYCKPEQVIVGEFLYKKFKSTELVMMNNGKVYTAEQLEQVVDELAAAGIVEVRRRTRDVSTVYSHLYDGSDWLEEEKETVFEWIPVIPTYCNFNISENKVIYRGVVRNLMDAQRVYNYAKSREIEEGALAPRGKYWMTSEQAKGYGDSLSTLNTNADPVQLYNVDTEAPPPFWQGGAQINAGLQTTAADAARAINVSAGMFSSNMGDNPGLQSGVAIELQQNKGDNGTIKYFKSQEVAICHTARILINAIPKVYDSERQIRVLNEDGSFEMVMLNEVVFDEQTKTNVYINDLSQGQYDVTCDVGQPFKNRQQETVKAITELAAINPSIITTGADVLLNSIQTPGIDIIAERVREQMLKSGLIPDDQMTDEEKEKMQAFIQAQMQNNQPGPADKIAAAELEKAQAQTADILSKIEERQINAQIEAEKLAQKQQETALKAQSQQFEQQMSVVQSLVNEISTQAQTLKTLREAMGVDSIVGPDTAEAYAKQAEIVNESQNQID